MKAGIIKLPPRTAYTAPSHEPCKCHGSQTKTVTGIVQASLFDKDQGLCQLASIVRCSDDAIISTSLEGLIETWNAAAEKIYGYRAEEAIGKSIGLLVPGDRKNESQQMLEEIRAGREVKHIETIRTRKSGEQIAIDLTISPIKSAAGLVVGASSIARKITVDKRADGALRDEQGQYDLGFKSNHNVTEGTQAEEILRDSQSKYRVLFEDSADARWLLDDKGFLDCNAAALAMFGFSAKADFKHPADISPPNQADGTPSHAAAEQKIAAALLNGKDAFEWLHQRKNGEVFPAEVSLAALKLGGRPMLMATVRDITERKVAEEKIQFLAYFDALTELPNRILLKDRLLKALAGARRRNEKVALLFLNLDRFKLINDSLGRSLGDRLLVHVAERLRGCTREQDTLARVGSDEFVIVLTGVKNPAEAAVAAGRIVNAIAGKFVVQGHSVSTSCSLGISIFPEHGEDSEILIKHAGQAMYCAKENGRNRFRFFTEELNIQAVERLERENELRLALENDEFFLAYQPQMDIVSGEITGLEALIRWQHPKLGLVPPDKFIGVAENCGLILPIGEWVLQTACSQARKWQEDGILAVPIAVNVSAVQFRQEGFCALIRKVLADTHLAPQYLELELTESLLLSNEDVVFSVLLELREMGLALAIDDFGTGYSSFSYLRKFRVNKLKIDRSFIQDIATDPDDAAITTAIINMAKSLRLKVIAEGVENEAQLSFLRSHQCDEIQGYYFCKPVIAAEVGEKLLCAPTRRGTAVNGCNPIPTGDWASGLGVQ